MEQTDIPSSSKRQSKVWVLIAIFLAVGILIGIGIGAGLFYHPDQATILVSLTNEIPNDVNYVIYVNGIYNTNGTLGINESNEVWVHAILSQTSQTITVMFSHLNQYNDEQSRLIDAVNDGNYHLSFTHSTIFIG